MCQDCSFEGAPGCHNHIQSPIDLRRAITADRACHDRHLMNYVPGDCPWNTTRFEILPHVLRMYHPQECATTRSNIDFSEGFPFPWMLSFTDISVPSQHTLEGVQYPAEVTLSHVYSENRTDRLVRVYELGCWRRATLSH